MAMPSPSTFVAWLSTDVTDAVDELWRTHGHSGAGDVINLFMDYETFGEHQWAHTGIFDFLESPAPRKQPVVELAHPAAQ